MASIYGQDESKTRLLNVNRVDRHFHLVVDGLKQWFGLKAYRNHGMRSFDETALEPDNRELVLADINFYRSFYHLIWFSFDAVEILDKDDEDTNCPGDTLAKALRHDRRCLMIAGNMPSAKSSLQLAQDKACPYVLDCEEIILKHEEGRMQDILDFRKLRKSRNLITEVPYPQ